MKRNIISNIRRIAVVLLALAVLLLLIFFTGRYSWKLRGFSACESAGIEHIAVTETQVEITGFYPGTFPKGFLGYHAEEAEGTLYVGFKFSGLFGIFETGDFHITIPTTEEISQVYIKTGENTYLIWSAEESTLDGAAQPSETEPVIHAGYSRILDAYASAIAQQWNEKQLMDEQLCYLIAGCRDADPENETGYALQDLDADGTPELLIGALAEDAYFGKLIFCMYTLGADAEPVLLFESGERAPYYYAGGALFAALGSSGCDDSFETTLRLEAGVLTDLGYATAPADYVQMELLPFSQQAG